jgi:hypothetical protein
MSAATAPAANIRYAWSDVFVMPAVSGVSIAERNVPDRAPPPSMTVGALLLGVDDVAQLTTIARKFW